MTSYHLCDLISLIIAHFIKKVKHFEIVCAFWRIYVLKPFSEAGVFLGVWWVGVEDIFDVGLAIREI